MCGRIIVSQDEDISVGLSHELWQVLKKAGLNKDDIGHIVNSPGNVIARRLAGYYNRFRLKNYSSLAARSEMGGQMFGPEEWTWYGFNIYPETWEKLAIFPWTREMLNSPCPYNPGKLVKDTHFAFVIFKPWLETLMEKFYRSNLLGGGIWSLTLNSIECKEPHWYLMPKEINTFKLPRRNDFGFPEPYDPVGIGEEFTKIMLYYLKFKKKLDLGKLVMTTWGDYVATIGCPRRKYVFINHLSKEDALEKEGLLIAGWASQRQPEW